MKSTCANGPRCPRASCPDAQVGKAQLLGSANQKKTKLKTLKKTLKIQVVPLATRKSVQAITSVASGHLRCFHSSTVVSSYVPSATTFFSSPLFTNFTSPFTTTPLPANSILAPSTFMDLQSINDGEPLGMSISMASTNL